MRSSHDNSPKVSCKHLYLLALCNSLRWRQQHDTSPIGRITQMESCCSSQTMLTLMVYLPLQWVPICFMASITKFSTSKLFKTNWKVICEYPKLTSRVWDQYLTENYMFSYTKAPPTCFKIGNIVEAQILFVAVPIQHNQVKVITQFQSLALLDATFSKVVLKTCYIILGAYLTSLLFSFNPTGCLRQQSKGGS